tara:strand:- start:259 stop:672 length:414 start_codon:yes stop_codon:yes gene_type:complete
MGKIFLLIIVIPLIEVYLFIKIGTKIGAFNTISLILITAIIGVYYARYEGLNALKSGMAEIVKNKLPIYEIISGAALAFAAFLLMLPGFATDTIGFLLIFPFTRKILLGLFPIKISEVNKKKDFIEGEFEDIDEDKK